jgi:hypothetical protein
MINRPANHSLSGSGKYPEDEHCRNEDECLREKPGPAIRKKSRKVRQ